MSTDTIISRVKKMMAIANDPAAAQGERDNALRMAYKTMSKYNLDEDDLVVKEIRQAIDLLGFSSPWARRISNSVAQLFFCTYYSERQGKVFKHKFIGKTSNVVTAQMMSEYIIKSIKSEGGKVARKDKLDNSWKTSFYKGAADVIYARCKELRQLQEAEYKETTGTALVLASMYDSESKANADFIASMGVRLMTKASKEQRAGLAGYTSGKVYGAGISLNGQINKPNTLRIG
jgi:hypothetical protein